MRCRTILVCAVLLAACTTDHKPAAAPASSSAPATTTTAPVTTAPPTTASPLTPIDGCPDPGPLAAPDPHRPVYTATAGIDVANGAVTGMLTVKFTPDVATHELVLRLWPNAPRLADAGVHEDVGVVTRDDGLALTVGRPDDTTVHVVLPSMLAAGDNVTVTMPYTLTVPGNTPDRVGHERDTLRLGSFLPLLAWEPGVGWDTDPPTSISAEAATSPVADYDVALTVPAGYDVLGTGERGADDHWRATAVRDVAYSIGHFTRLEQDVDAVHVIVGVDASVNEAPERYMNLIVDALRNYQARFGAYPWPVYSAAVLPGFHGGIEFPMAVMEAEGSADRSIVHELAHQWFYALVGNDQGRDPWLDEGLASYAEFVQVNSLTRHTGERTPSDAAGRAGQPMAYWDNHAASYYAGVYVQAAVGVASLGTVDQVDCALRQYVARNAFRIATPADVFAALETVFPDAPDRLASYGLGP